MIPPAEQWQTAVHNLRELGNYAADLGRQIALELEPFSLSLLNNVDRMVRFRDEVDHPAGHAARPLQGVHLAPSLPFGKLAKKRKKFEKKWIFGLRSPVGCR